MKQRKRTVLIPFHAGAVVYGMERGVIEIFDLLRPELEPHFLMSYTTQREDLPILKEIKARNLSHSFLSDRTPWPRIGKPKSLRDAWLMFRALVKGNRDVLKAAHGKDVIYIPGTSYFWLSAVALLKQRVSGRQVAFQFHDLLIRRSLFLRIVGLFVTDFIHCSRLGLELVSKQNSFILKRRNHVLPYRTGSHRGFTQKLSVNGDFKDKLNLLFFGQVSRHKGVDIVLEAFEKLAAEHPDAILHIAGGYSDSEFESVCTDIMKRPHLKDRIVYWGFVDNVEPLLELAYVHVHPSPPSRFMDTFPLAALESMKHGVPTVCFKSGGLPEMIVDGVTGIICKHETPAAFAAGLKSLLANSALREQYSQNARERYRQLYSEEPVKSGWLKLFFADIQPANASQ